MDSAFEQNWKEIFALAAEAKAAKRREEHIKLLYDDIDREKDKKHKREEKDEKEIKELEEALATSAQIAAFGARLDDYDTKTVEALMTNREALDAVRDELHCMIEEAYVLPDGRRVFKTADGRQVFDEHGLELSLKTIDPDAIGDNHPRWETYKEAKGAESKLVVEQHDLLEFQAKVDEARTRADKGDITRNELDDLDADLKASAPPAVRQKLGIATPAGERDGKPRLDGTPPEAQAALISDPSRRAQPGYAPF